MLNGFVIGDRGLGASGDTHPAWMMAHGRVGSYLVVGASAVGQIHLARELPRDDAFVIRSTGPWVAVGVADGVGSRPLSRYGATYAAESLSAMLLRDFDSMPKVATAEPGPGPQASGRSDPAPPPWAENIQLRPSVLLKGSGAAALAHGVVNWTRRVTGGAEQSVLKDVPTGDFEQAASIGWWLSHAAMQRSAGAVATTSTSASPDATSDQSAGLSASQAVPTEPDLVAIMRKAFEKTHLGLRQHANGLGLSLADLSCTALALLLNLETGRGAVGQVGDGALLGLTAQGKVKELVDAPDTGDPQSTYTLNRPNFQNYLDVQVIESVASRPYVAFFVMTDGLSGDLLYSPAPEALENWAEQVDRNLRLSATPAQAAAGLLNWLATYQVKGSWDDRTLVVITRMEQRERDNDNRQSATGQPEPAQSTDHR